MGAGPSGERLARMRTSPQWRDGHVVNQRPTRNARFSEMLWAAMSRSSDHARPASVPEPLARRRADYDAPPATGLRVTWLGHSSLLVELDGARVLIDPVWGERASPLTWAGPQRWYPPPLPMRELPDLDAVLISHDHYDHLDHPTVLAMLDRDVPWIVPLGVGAHLEQWGVPRGRIIELDWWQAHEIGETVFTATPARHFSGRFVLGPGDGGGPTLWSGWAIAGPEHRVYYSGDTALFDELEEIGERLGPFDLTMIETGAYSELWADVHLGPEQAVRAHQLVRGRVMLPVHWGLFSLAFHGWTEPIERTLVAAEARGVDLRLPRPGQMLEPDIAAHARQRWWPDVPWQTAARAPVISSGTGALMGR